MFLYLAGSTTPKRLEQWAEDAPQYAPIILKEGDDPLRYWHQLPNFLFTFFYADARKCARHFCVQPCAYDFCSHPHRRIFIDSGAFSAHNKDTEINFDEYMAFCDEIQRLAKCQVTFVALDIIAGKKGERATPKQKEEACEQGWNNYQMMKRAGIPCLMTFHQGENIKQLTRIADDSDYFAVAPRKDKTATTTMKRQWLEWVFQYVGQSKKRIHGLGISSKDFLKEFPFFSVDRTDWLWGGKLGRYPLPNGRFRSLDEWTELFWHDGKDWEELREELREILAYGTYGVKPDPEARRGAYWFMTLAISREMQRQREITEFWREKGVVWDDDQKFVNREAVYS